MNPPPSLYPYGVPPPGMPFPGAPGVPPMMPPGAAFRPLGVMPPMMPLQRPQVMRPTTLSRPPVLPAPAGAPVVVTPSPRLTPIVLPPKSTTLYVGKIAPSIDDNVIKALLEACGPVKSWKRVQDPDTQQPKGFGFCEYEEAEGVLKALQLLNNLSLDGQELLLKWNTATQKYIEELQARKEREAAAAKAKGEDTKADSGAAAGAEPAAEAGTAEEGEDTEASKDNAILEKIMAIVSEQASRASAHEAADEFLSGMREDRGRRREEDRGRSSRNARDGGHRAAERLLEADFAREKERERSRAHERHQELQRAYEERERAWLKHERDVKNRAEKEQEHERTVQKERARRIRADLDHADSDGEEDPWERKPIASSHRTQARKRLREKEESDDAADRDAEAHDRAAKQLRGESMEGHDRHRENGSAHAAASGEANMHVDINDPIYQAMIAAAKEQPKPAALPQPPPRSAEQLEQDLALQQAACSRSAPSGTSPAADSWREGQRPSRPSSKPLLSVFGGDEDEDKPKRKLIPLTYTEEEKLAMQETQAAASPGRTVDNQAAIKKLMNKIPTDKGAVFAYPIKWEAYDKFSFSMAPKLSQWVLKKTKELLGEEELSMVEYVMNMLKEHVQPGKMMETLSSVMDNETQPFVLKLFRMVIFETEKAALGIVE